MNCPICTSVLHTITYEGIEIETCRVCGGNWLDAGELGKIVRMREVRFNEAERRALARATKIAALTPVGPGRQLACPKCSGRMAVRNYGSDSGIFIDRCTACRGMWLDAGEIEKIQMLVEAWEAMLPEELKTRLRKFEEVTVEAEGQRDAQASRIPLIRRFINVLLHGMLDLEGT